MSDLTPADAARLVDRILDSRRTGADDWHTVPLKEAEQLAAALKAAQAELARLRAPVRDSKGKENMNMPEDAIATTQARRILLHGTGALTFDDLVAVTLYPLIHGHDPWTEENLEKVWARQYPYCLYINGRRFRVPFRHLIGSQIAEMVSNGNYQLLDGKDKPIALNTYVDLDTNKEPLHFFTVPPCRE